MNYRRLLLLAACLGLVAGCGPKTRYSWKGYDQKLYQHYKNPADQEEFAQNLLETIQEGEANNNVPPGIYAEYGYALHEKGNFGEAVRYYKLESEKWPESRALMAKMISNAEKGGKAKRPADAPAPAAPAAPTTNVSDAKGATQ